MSWSRSSSLTMVGRATSFCAVALVCGAAFGGDYDPLAISKEFQPQVVDTSVHDEARKRDIPIKVYLPAEKTPAAVLLFSHGLGGSREMGSYLGKHWSARGYVTIFLQHPGSDVSVWQNEPIAKRMALLQEAASGENLLLRLEDVPAVLNQLEKWHKTEGHALVGRCDLTKIGMAGHSFGALTTQGVSGQSMPIGGPKYTDRRIKAAVVMSPSTPRAGSAQAAFGGVKTPWLLMTGTNDVARIGGQTMEMRRGVYPALPEGSKYELVLHNGAHSAFTDRAIPGEQRNPNHHRVILATSTAFWDAYLREDTSAKTWLDGTGPRSVLETEDLWQRK